jgi:hypothetical protein
VTATAKVQSACRKLALKRHPDRNPGDRQAEERAGHTRGDGVGGSYAAPHTPR